jgi:predicted enzyme related to lactoylglutathione lyase
MMRRLLSATRALLVPGVLALISACSAVSIDLPPVARSDVASHPGKFIWHDLISDDVDGSRRFYGELFGWEFRRLRGAGGNYWLISLDGRPVAGMVEQASLRAERDISQWVSLLSVADAEATVRRVTAGGGSVLRQPVSLGERGTVAVFLDPEGALFATLSTGGRDPADGGGRIAVGDFLWHELWSPAPDAVAGFYADIAGLEVERGSLATDGGTPAPYHLLRSEGRARGGVRALPAADVPTLWMPYLRVADRSGLDALLEKVPTLGGEVLVPAQARQAGGFLAVIAGPSGAPLALQSWNDGQPAVEAL